MKTVKCERFVQKGFCIGFENNRTYLIKGAIPDETVEVKIVSKKRKGRILECEVANVLKKSLYRTNPKCKYYQKCGGCDFQHINYVKQIYYKREILSDALRHNAGIDIDIDSIEINPHKTGWNYRNKFSMPYDYSTGKLGFYIRNTHDIVLIDECDIIKENLNNALQFLNSNLLPSMPLRYVIGRVNFKGDVSVVFVSYKEFDFSFINLSPFKNVYLNINNSEGNRIIGDKTITIKGSDYIEDIWNGITIRYSPTAFLQVNKEIAENIYEEIKNNVEGKKVCDLFCGIGILSVYLSQNNFDVVGVESFEPSVESAKTNANINDVNAMFVKGDANNFDINEFDTVIIDPPRKGLEENLRDKLSYYKGRIIYMSCYPQTLARDVKDIIKRGKKIEKIKIYDMFPQTHHFETLVIID